MTTLRIEAWSASQSLWEGPEGLGAPAAPFPRLHGARRGLPDRKASGGFRLPAHAPRTALSATHSPARAENAFGDASASARPSVTAVADFDWRTMTALPAGDWRLAVYGSRSAAPAYRTRPRSADRKRVAASQGDDCLYCGIPIGTVITRQVPLKKRYSRSTMVTLQRTWDHFVPYAYLLRNPASNWVLACHVCNLIKKARMFDTVEDARKVILPERERLGYEPAGHVLARLAVSEPDDGPVLDAEHMPESMTNAEAAQVLGISARNLTSWRAKGRGPGWNGHGTAVRYSRDDVQNWLAARAERRPARENNAHA